VRPVRANRLSKRFIAAATLELVAAVAVATGVVALLDQAAPITGLGVIYLLAVLLIAIRRGELAALATAVLSVLALNFFFIEPRHQLTISNSENVVALIVFLIAAIVVGRLAATGRQRATEAEERANEAAAREREAKLLAAAASAVLESTDLDSQLAGLEESIATTGEGRLRIELQSAPATAEGELAVPLSSRKHAGWLYGREGADLGRADLERMAEPLGRLVDVAFERREVLHRSTPGRLQHLVQLHLSRECNRPELAQVAARAVVQGLPASVEVHTASQDEPGRTLHLGGAGFGRVRGARVDRPGLTARRTRGEHRDHRRGPVANRVAVGTG
jgi:hypothetical protein